MNGRKKEIFEEAELLEEQFLNPRRVYIYLEFSLLRICNSLLLLLHCAVMLSISNIRELKKDCTLKCHDLKSGLRPFFKMNGCLAFFCRSFYLTTNNNYLSFVITYSLRSFGYFIRMNFFE